MMELSEIEEAREAIEAGYGLPNGWFFDPAVHEFELDGLFGDGWTAIGPVARLQAAGTYITGQIGRVPVLATRDDAGIIRSFVNVCRHRGYAVAEEDGKARVLVCRYHAWTYNLDGSLRNARRCPVEAGDPNLGLIELPTHVTRGLIFVNPNLDAEPFEQRHPEFEEIAERQQYDMSGFDHVGTHVFEVPANWKSFNENVAECYHCPTIHPASFGSEFDVDAADWHTSSDQIWFHSFPFKGEDGEERLDRGVYLFPSVMLFDNGVMAGTGYATPTGPESSRFVLDVLASPGADREQVEHMRSVYVQTLNEDIAVISRQHLGIRSGKVDRFVMFEENEPMVRFFHRRLLALYERALGRTPLNA